MSKMSHPDVRSGSVPTMSPTTETPNKEAIDVHKTLDKCPILTYNGRQIEVTSDGVITKVFVNGKEVHARRITIHAAINEITTVTMEVYDIGDKPK